MISRRNRALEAKLLGDLGTVAASTAFGAELSVAITVALRAFGTMHVIVNRTLDADNFSRLRATVKARWRTIVTLAALLTPTGRVEITHVAARAVIAVIGSALLANDRAYDA